MHNTDRRRILIFGINYAPEPTGIAVQTSWLAEGLQRDGWDVAVVTGMPHYPWWRRQSVPPTRLDAGVTVIRRNHYVPSKHSVFTRSAYEVTWLANSMPLLLTHTPVDVVLGIVPSLGGAVLAAGAARRFSVPHVLLFQDLLGPAVRQCAYKGTKSVGRIVRSIELGLARDAARVAVIAEGFRHYLVDGGVRPERIDRVRNPVNATPPTRDRATVRAAYGWRDSDVIVLHSGNMGFKQALESVLHAAELARSQPQIRFVLQGDGNRRPELEQLARQLGLENLDFRPLASSGDLSDVLAAADILLLNQGRQVKDMSLPSKLTSYFSVGGPVVAAVAADSEAAREVLASGGGIVVTPEDPRALLDAIGTLASDVSLRRRLGAAGEEFARTQLGADNAISAFKVVLDRAVEARSGLPNFLGQRGMERAQAGRRIIR